MSQTVFIKQAPVPVVAARVPRDRDEVVLGKTWGKFKPGAKIAPDPERKLQLDKDGFLGKKKPKLNSNTASSQGGKRG